MFCWKKKALKYETEGETTKPTKNTSDSLKTTFYFSTPKIGMQDFQNSKTKRYTLKMCELLEP